MLPQQKEEREELEKKKRKKGGKKRLGKDFEPRGNCQLLHHQFRNLLETEDSIYGELRIFKIQGTQQIKKEDSRRLLFQRV